VLQTRYISTAIVEWRSPPATSGELLNMAMKHVIQPSVARRIVPSPAAVYTTSFPERPTPWSPPSYYLTLGRHYHSCAQPTYPV